MFVDVWCKKPLAIAFISLPQILLLFRLVNEIGDSFIGRENNISILVKKRIKQFKGVGLLRLYKNCVYIYIFLV